jgi:hypothetical protein
MPLYPLPVVVAVAVWLWVFFSTGKVFIFSGLSVIAAGVVAFLLWSRRVGRWPFERSKDTD